MTDSGQGDAPTHGARFVTLRGQSTSLCFALPAFGAISVGRSEKSDIKVVEPGVADEHLVLHVDYGLGLQAHDEDTELSTGAAVPLEKTVDVSLDDRIRMGSVEISFSKNEVAKSNPRVYGPAYLKTRLEAAKPSLNPLVCVADVSGKLDLEGLLPRVSPAPVAGMLSSASIGFFFEGISETEARNFCETLKANIEAAGGTCEYGVATPADGSLEVLFDVAASRTRSDDGMSNVALQGSSPKIEEVKNTVEQVAKTSSHVLILGETGTGKDVAARLIHTGSERGNRSMVEIDCVDLTDGFLESGEDNDETVLEKAAGSTLLLNEVGGLSPRAQLRLGHVLERMAAAARTKRRIPVRVLATSNLDLKAEVEAGRFRKDLFFRLNRVTLVLPPLRERRSDIIELAEHFLAQSDHGDKQINKGATDLLERHAWPGNVRELRNTIERAAFVAQGDAIAPGDLPDEVQNAGGSPAPSPTATAAEGGARLSLREEIQELERRRILEALDAYPTQTEAAKALDIPLRTFLNRLDALGIPRARKTKKS